MQLFREDQWPHTDELISKEDFPKLWEKVTELFPLLEYEQKLLIVALVTDTCHSCFAANASCQCWNDE